METQPVDVVVIGAGQAGLSTAYHLQHYGFAPETGFVVLDGNPAPGGAWQHRWSDLRLGDAHGIHALPGTGFAPADTERPAAEVVAEYFADYERRFAVPVHRPVQVTAVRRVRDQRLRVESTSGTWTARVVINATGSWTKPFVPHYPGITEFRGWQLHTVDYRTPEVFRGRRVVVVGGGISAVELLSAISEVATTTWVTRRPPEFTGSEFTTEDGRRAVAAVEQRTRAGHPPGSVVSATGLPETPAIRQARHRGVLDHRLPMFDRITPDGIAWNDGRSIPADTILWSTGFRPELDHLAPLQLREPGGGIRLDGTRAVGEPRLHLVGYGSSASTVGATRNGRLAARATAQQLRPQTAQPGAQRPAASRCRTASSVRLPRS
ncbi:NAD(P)-binding domain-containing protein [Bounagaea algeriensis]